MNVWSRGATYSASCSEFAIFDSGGGVQFEMLTWSEAFGQRSLLFMCLVAVHGPDSQIFTIIPLFFKVTVASFMLHNLDCQLLLNVDIIGFVEACLLDLVADVSLGYF